jgi:acetyltransferase-like isoleucine patch superfamily enzyme
MAFHVSTYGVPKQMPLRRVLKRTVFAVAVLLVSPLILAARLESLTSNGEGFFTCFGEGLSILPGRLGSFLRLAYYWGTLQSCTMDVVFSFGTKINHRAAEIGSYVLFGSYCNVGVVTIGDHVLIASRVSIPSGARQHDASSQSPCIPDSTPRLQRVHIGSNVWIGEGAIILADVDTRCIIGAGAVVTRTIPSGATVVGNPAKVHSRYPAAQPDGGEPTEATTTDSARDPLS